MDNFKCTSCHLEIGDFREFSKHLRRHENDPYFTQKCNFCDSVFNSSRSWQRHVSIHISRRRQDPKPCTSSGDPQHPTSSMDEEYDADVEFSENTEAIEATPDAGRLDEESENQVADFLIKLRARGIPMNACMEIVKEMKSFGRKVVQECEEKSAKEPEGEASTAALTNTADDVPSLKGLSDIDSAHKLYKFAKLERGYVAPVTVKLDGDNGFQYVPVKSQLAGVFADKEAADKLRFGSTSPTGTYADICDGDSHRAMEEGIHLILYFDEFVISNPLGNKTSKYLIGAMYFIIANLERRSRLKDMHLCVLFRASHIKKFGWDKILEPLLSDLKSLEQEGIEVVFSNGGRKHVPCFLDMMVGDNKGVHDIAGFFKAFVNTKRVCRTCHAETEDIQTKFNVSDFQLRTVQGYEDEIGLVEKEQFDPEIQRIFGLHRRCELNVLGSFHCMTSFALDVSHDVFEDGVARHAVEQVLDVLLQARLFKVEEFNDAVSSLKYHRVDGNKPQPCQKKGGISAKQTCAEMWTLLRLLPLILSTITLPRPPEEGLKAAWDLLTGLISIVQILMALVIHEADVKRLEKLVEEWLMQFHQCFPSFRMKPKMHYLLHYAHCIREHGPPFRYSAIRFEAKHSELKRYMKNSQNFMNVCKSMAVSCQLGKCSNQNDDTKQPDQNGSYKEHVSDFHYVSGDIVVQKCEAGQVTQYIKVAKFRNDNDDWVVVGTVLKDVRYVDHLCALSVNMGDPVEVPVSRLAPVHPLGMYSVSGQQYVIPLTINHL